MRIVIIRKSILIDIFILFIVLPYTSPIILQEYYSFGSIINYWKIISLVLFLLYSLRNKVKVNQQMKILLIIVVYLLLISFGSNEASVRAWMSQTISFTFLAFVAATVREDILHRLLKILFWILFIETVINFISQFIYPKGIYLAGLRGRTLCFVLGMENRFVFTYIACIFCGLVLKYIKKEYTIFLYLEILIATLSLIKAWSVGAMCGLLLFDVIIIFSEGLKKVIDSVNTTVIWLIGNIGIVIYGAQAKYLGFLEKYLGKDIASVSGRVRIWDAALYRIKKNPIWGYGILEGNVTKKFFLGFAHPHNEILQLLIQGGIIGMVLHLWFLVSCLRDANNIKGSKLYCEIIGAYFSLMIMLWLDSWTSTSYFYLIFILISSLGMIANNAEK